MSNSNKFPETLVPDRPSIVTGTFDSYDIGIDKNGKEQPIALLVIDGRSRSLWLLTKVLRKQFREVNPEKDETVVVNFAGEKTRSANGRDYWDDTVTAPDRPVEEITVDHPLFRVEGDDDAPDVQAPLSDGKGGGDADIPF
jgi:hypothetical protein